MDSVMTSPEFPPAPFKLRQAAQPCGVILSSPHSGSYYPADLVSAARLDPVALRRSEDAFVDQLIAHGVSCGMDVFSATHARAFVDVNRDPAELDPSLFFDPPSLPTKPSDRVQAGLGVLPRVVGVGLDIYAHRFSFAAAQRRITELHKPYHARLTQLVAEARARHGFAILLDWHSMPSAAVMNTRSHNSSSRPRIVLGDFGGRACAPHVTEAVLNTFDRRGYAVAVNDPYAGGYTTQRYGKPHQGVHALQIEIDRTLYMDELLIKPHAGFVGLRETLMSVLDELAVSLPALQLGFPASAWPLAAE